MDLQEIANRVAAMPLLAVDTETYDKDLTTKGPGFVRGDAEVVGISLAWPAIGGPVHPATLSMANAADRSMQAGKDIASVYLPIAHEGGGNMDKTQVLAVLMAGLAARTRPVVMANAAYDLEALRSHGVVTRAPVYDVQIAEALLDENRRSYKLDVLAEHYLGERKLTDALTNIAVIKLGVKKDKAMGHIWRLPASDVAEYAAADAALTLGIWQKQELLIVREDLCRVWRLECDLVPVLHAMRWHGVRIDVDGAVRFVERQTGMLEMQQNALKGLAGEEVQIWAGVSVSKTSKAAGAPPLVEPGEKDSFTSPAMEKSDHPFFKHLVAARRIDKAITYVQSLVDYQINGRVHCQYHQTRARTGRLSASHPNLQQVPGRHEELAKPIRQLFLPDYDGELWDSNDYDQAEPRITVHYAHAMGLTGAAGARQRYIDDPATDYHNMVADLCNIARFPAKTLNLGLAYGMGKKKMAAALGLPIEEAEPLFHQYHAGVPFVKLLSERCTQVAIQRGYVKTISGRRRRFDLWGPRRYEQGMVPLKFDEAKEKWGANITRWFTHKAMNSVVQGTAADILKTAMVDLYREGVVPLMSIHDDLACSVQLGTLGEERARMIKYIMESTLPLSVPHLVEPAIGPTWGDCK